MVNLRPSSKVEMFVDAADPYSLELLLGRVVQVDPSLTPC